jgi:hypothetical protein
MMKRREELWRFSRLQPCKDLNTIVEQVHRRSKWLVRAGLASAAWRLRMHLGRF